jgi:SNF family Na+-dependent transporter
MSLKSKLKIEDIGMFTAFIFYAIVGITFFAVLFMANFPSHIGIIGILSLITAYGLFEKRDWAFWLVVMLFFVATTFSAVTLYYVLGNDFLLSAIVIAYLILTWVFTAYTATKRKTLKS